MYEILNKHMEFLTTQYKGICKSAYTKGYELSTNKIRKVKSIILN